MRASNRTRLATAISCVGVVVIGLSFENFVLSFSLAAALCIGSLSYGAWVYDSRIKAAKLFLLNAGLLVLTFAVLRVTLHNWRFPREYWAWLHRIFRVWWLSECSAIILVLIATGLLAIEAASNLGGDATRKRFQWSIIAAASILVAVNFANFLRPAECRDCFFPYGLPFPLYTEGGEGGGEGFVWLGLVFDAALIRQSPQSAHWCGTKSPDSSRLKRRLSSLFVTLLGE